MTDYDKPRYAVNDDVWVLFDETLIKTKVESVIGRTYYLRHVLRLTYENEVYPSRDALIEAQIEYWQRLLKCGSPTQEE